MRYAQQILATAFLTAGLVGATGAGAATIFVANASFETLPAGGLPFGGCGVGCSYSNAAIPDWTTSPSSGALSGQFQPGSSSGNTTYFNYVPDGLTIAYSNGGTISQIVSPLAQAGVTYTLTVDVGARKDQPDLSTVELLVGADSVIATHPGGHVIGGWNEYTAVYTATAADAGLPIEILLSSSGIQGDWDNVNLSSDVTEPSTWAMMLLGCVGLGVAGYRRARNRGASPAMG